MTHNAHPIRGFVSSYGWVVASPLGRHGPQVRAPWHHGGHGAVDVVGPVAPPGHACGCGDAGVYTDRRKWPLRAVSGRLCTLLGCGLGLWGPWDRNSVHKWEDRASPRRFGAFVYTVGLWRHCGRSRRKLWCMGGGRRRPSPILECRSDQETTERKRRWSAPIG